MDKVKSFVYEVLVGAVLDHRDSIVARVDTTRMTTVMDTGSDENCVPGSMVPDGAMRTFDNEPVIMRDISGAEIPETGTVDLHMSIGGVLATSRYRCSRVSKMITSVGKLVRAGYTGHLELENPRTGSRFGMRSLKKHFESALRSMRTSRMRTWSAWLHLWRQRTIPT